MLTMPGESAWMVGLTPEFIEKAKEELGETPEVKKLAIKELKKLINAEVDFRPQTDDAFLVRFLRAKKYNVGKAFQTMRHYYIFQAKYFGVLTGFTPLQVARILDMNNILVLPTRHSSGAAVGIMRIGCFDIDKVSFEELFGTMMAGMEMVIEPEATQVCGYIFIMDFSKFNLRMVQHYARPNLIYQFVKVVQDCIPYRVKAFHVIHEPLYCVILYNIVKKFLSEKISKRIYFHGNNLKTLYQHVPPELLPTEYGGEVGSSLKYAKEFGARLLSREHLFQKSKHYGYQENEIHLQKKQDSRTLLK